VTGGVDDVDLHVAPADRCVLGEDGDALLTLQVHGVHDPLGHLFVGPEYARLAEEGVDEGRLAVVDVCDHGDVAEVGTRAPGVLRSCHVKTLEAGRVRGAEV